MVSVNSTCPALYFKSYLTFFNIQHNISLTLNKCCDCLNITIKNNNYTSAAMTVYFRETNWWITVVKVTDINCLRHINVNVYVCEQGPASQWVSVCGCTIVLFYLSYLCQSSSVPPPHPIHHHGNRAKYSPPPILSHTLPVLPTHMFTSSLSHQNVLN